MGSHNSTQTSNSFSFNSSSISLKMAAIATSATTFKGLALRAERKSATAAPVKMAVRASMSDKIEYAAKSVATAAVATAVSLSLSGVASAVDVKLGSDGGALVFEPAEITISAGDSVTWVNNVGYPHNVVFDEDEIPEGVDVDGISHYDLLNGKGDVVSSTFDTAGEYSYYCEPHQGAGMVGTIIVQ